MNVNSGSSHNLNNSGICDYCGLPLSAPPHDNKPAYCCFGCRFADSISRESADPSLQVNPASALGLSVFFTMNVIMMTMALWTYADNNQSHFEQAIRNFLRYGAMCFSAPVLLLLGRPLFSHAITALKRAYFTTDLLLTIGVIAAFIVSVVNTVRDDGHVYFEVGCVIQTC
jgi:cation transport ATPase